jgi:hypothetical protein
MGRNKQVVLSIQNDEGKTKKVSIETMISCAFEKTNWRVLFSDSRHLVLLAETCHNNERG